MDSLEYLKSSFLAAPLLGAFELRQLAKGRPVEVL